MDRSEWKNPFKCSTALRSICELPDVCDTWCQQTVLFWNHDLLETLAALVYKTRVRDQWQDGLLLYTEYLCPSKIHRWSSDPGVAVLGNGVSKEVNRVNRGYEHEALIGRICVLRWWDTRELTLCFLSMRAQRRGIVSAQRDGWHPFTMGVVLRMKPTLLVPWFWTSPSP